MKNTKRKRKLSSSLMAAILTFTMTATAAVPTVSAATYGADNTLEQPVQAADINEKGEAAQTDENSAAEPDSSKDADSAENAVNENNTAETEQNNADVETAELKGVQEVSAEEKLTGTGDGEDLDTPENPVTPEDPDKDKIYTIDEFKQEIEKQTIKYNISLDVKGTKLTINGTSKDEEGVIPDFDEDGRLILPSGKGKKAPWFNSSVIKDIVIGAHIRSIGDNAFAGCDVENVEIESKALTSIDSGIFADTKKLRSIKLPDSVTFIAEDAFSGSSVNMIELPENMSGDAVKNKPFASLGDSKNSKNVDICFYINKGTAPKNPIIPVNKQLYGSANIKYEIQTKVELENGTAGVDANSAAAMTIRNGSNTKPITGNADTTSTYVSSNDSIDIEINKGYSFSGWVSNNDNKVTYINIKNTNGKGTLTNPFKVDNTAQYTLKVQPKKYTVKLNAGEGAKLNIDEIFNNGKTYAIGDNISLPELTNVSDPPASKDGYKFYDWVTYKDKDKICSYTGRPNAHLSVNKSPTDGGAPDLSCLVYILKGDNIKITDDMIESYDDSEITFYVHWIPENYGISYMHNSKNMDNATGATGNEKYSSANGGNWVKDVYDERKNIGELHFNNTPGTIPSGTDILTRTGFKFVGWLTKNKYGETYNKIFNVGEPVKAEDIHKILGEINKDPANGEWPHAGGTMYLYAAWQFDLTFNANGGTIQENGKDLTDETKNGYKISYVEDISKELPNVELDNNPINKKPVGPTVIVDKNKNITIKNPSLKKFVGWALNENETDKTKILEPSEIWTLYLKGTIPDTSGTTIKYQKFAKETILTEYLGISDDEDNGELKSLLADNITLYAIWEETNCNVTYDANGGEFVEQVPSDQSGSKWETINFSIAKKDNKIKHIFASEKNIKVDIDNTTKTFDLEHNGYNFIGWSTDKNATSNSSDIAKYKPGEEAILDEDLMLYAVWEEKDASVIFHGNGGQDKDKNEEYLLDTKYGNTFKLPTIEEVGFSYLGHAFQYWITEIGSLKEHNPGEEVVFNDSNSEYWAKWTEIRYNVKFDSNVPEGVTVSGKLPKDITGVNYSEHRDIENTDDLKRAGYKFKGWSLKKEPNLKPAGGGSVTSGPGIENKKYDELYTSDTGFEKLADSYDSEGNPVTVTLYAVWEPIEYTVKFVGDYETANPAEISGSMESQTIKCDEKVKLNKNKFTKKVDGKVYDFVGWYDPTIKTDTDNKDEAADGDNKPEAVKPVVHYTDGEEVQNLIDPKDLVENPKGDENVKTLYAVWETTSPLEIVVASEGSLKDTSGGTIKIDSTTVGAINNIDVIVNKTLGYKNITVTPNEGYEFKGWYAVTTAQDGTQTIGAHLKGTDGKNAADDLSNYAYDGKTNGTIAACFAKKQYGIGLKVENGGIIKMSDKAFNTDGNTVEASSRTVSFDKDGASGSYRLKYDEKASEAFVYIAAPGTGNYDKSITINKNGAAFKSYDNSKVAELLKNGSFTGSLADLLGVSGDTEISADDNYEITISFQLIIQKFKVTASAGSNGTITPEGVTESESGKPIKVQAKANDGYYVSKVTINGTAQTLTSFDTTWSREFTSDTTIEAEFAVMPPSVKVTSIDPINGTLTLSRSGSVPVGSSITATASPDSGYRVKGIYINGESKSTSRTYTFTVQGDTTVEVAFEEGRGTSSSDRVFIITGTTDGNGTLSIGSEAEVERGDDLTVEIKAKVGYAVDRVTIDGKRISSTYSYTFKNVRDSHRINVTFKRDNRTYTVTGKSGTGGNLSIGTEELLAGEDLTVRITPYANYRISDVKVDGQSVGRVNSYKFESVHEDHTIEAVFGESSYNEGQYGVSNDDGIVNITGSTFIDVPASSWYFPSVKYVCERGLVSSTGMNTFSPDTNASRAVIVSMMYNNQGRPPVSSGSKYSDVSASSWYSNAVVWGTQNGVINGVSATMFKPNGEVTREQLAAMFYRYAQYRGVNVTNTVNTKVMSYSDAGKVSPYAMDALSWACNVGLLNGKSNTILDPQGTATRAEVSTIMMRFCQNYL